MGPGDARCAGKSAICGGEDLIAHLGQLAAYYVGKVRKGCSEAGVGPPHCYASQIQVTPSEPGNGFDSRFLGAKHLRQLLSRVGVLHMPQGFVRREEKIGQSHQRGSPQTGEQIHAHPLKRPYTISGNREAYARFMGDRTENADWPTRGAERSRHEFASAVAQLREHLMGAPASTYEFGNPPGDRVRNHASLLGRDLERSGGSAARDCETQRQHGMRHLHDFLALRLF